VARFFKTPARSLRDNAGMTLFTHFTVDIAAPPEKVWRALTEPALTRLYMFGCEALSDWTPGSPLVWRGEWEGKAMVFVTGRVVTFDPPRVLAYTTFDPNGGLADVPENHVTMTCALAPLGAGTRLSLSQGDFAKVQDGEKRFADASRDDGFLAKLKAVAESA